MHGEFVVVYTDAARADLFRLFDHLLERAVDGEGVAYAQAGIDAIVRGIEQHLPRMPLAFRKVGTKPFVRELVIPFGREGYVVLYEIEGKDRIGKLAVRRQLENDYH